MNNLVHLTKPFDEHRCTPNPVMRPAHWMSGLALAFRVYPAIEERVPTDTPNETLVFYCPDCKLIGLAPGKMTR